MPFFQKKMLDKAVPYVAIARGGTMVRSTLRQSWQQQPSSNTKRGKPHRATPKARLWDEPPQLARALPTGT